MKKIALALMAFGIVGSAHAGLYMPVGPQTNVALSTVTSGGWTQCYASDFSTAIGNSGEKVLNACQGDKLMMAGRIKGSDSFLVLAAADYADTIVNTGTTSNTHLANGSRWYYASNWSWGFTSANDSVTLSSCDTSASSPTSMCLHTLAQVGGYRINNISGLNGSRDYEKVFFVANAKQDGDVPEPASMLLLGAGAAALAAGRRRTLKRA
jgi:hypothetical protein